MAIGPIGNVIYVNQQTPFAALLKTDFNGRLEIQNIMAQQIVNEKEKEISEPKEVDEIETEEN